MGKQDKLEIARRVLNNAGNMNISKDIILKISQKTDSYIIEYYRKSEVERKRKSGDQEKK